MFVLTKSHCILSNIRIDLLEFNSALSKLHTFDITTTTSRYQSINQISQSIQKERKNCLRNETK